VIIYFLYLGAQDGGISATAAAAAAAAESTQSFLGLTGPPEVYLFCLFIVVSRVGLWMYDMVVSQIFQVIVPTRISGVVSSSEAALCSFAELSMLGIASVLAAPEQFGQLVVLSACAIVISVAIYMVWGCRLYLGLGSSRMLAATERDALLQPLTTQHFKGSLDSVDEAVLGEGGLEREADTYRRKWLEREDGYILYRFGEVSSP